jgi:hypothetical protein
VESLLLRHLWVILGIYGLFQVFMPVSSGFMGVSSGNHYPNLCAKCVAARGGLHGKRGLRSVFRFEGAWR